MTMLPDLEQQYPGLFKAIGCQSIAEAENHADDVAARLGLRMRKVLPIGDEGNRHIEYQNSFGTLKLRVKIREDRSGRSSTPTWLFGVSAERMDAHLTAESEHTVLIKPSSFEREAREIIERLRKLTVKKGRVLGRLKQWNAAKGVGVIECVRGALVNVHGCDMPSGSRIRHNEQFSFLVEQSAPMRQRAIKVRTCSGH